MVSFHAPNEAHSTSASGPGGGSADGLRTRDSARPGGVLAREFPGSGWQGGASSVLGAEPGDVAGEAAGGPRRRGSILSPLQFRITPRRHLSNKPRFCSGQTKVHGPRLRGRRGQYRTCRVCPAPTSNLQGAGRGVTHKTPPAQVRIPSPVPASAGRSCSLVPGPAFASLSRAPKRQEGGRVYDQTAMRFRKSESGPQA